MSQTSSPVLPFNTDLRMALVAMVRKRVPESEVEDIVQATMAEAFESPHAPEDAESLRRWIFGVAKNKVVDYHRRQGRLSYELPADLADAPAPHVEQDMLRWAERHLPEGEDAKKTLDWMLREGDGEKLETIAEAEKLPAPRVRQRVSRLRRHLKDHWQKEVAVLAALGVLMTAIVLLYLRQKDPKEPIAHDPKAVPIDPRAEPLRQEAIERCRAGDYTNCLEKLDEAKGLDPAGDARPDVQQLRRDPHMFEVTPPLPTPTTSAPPLPTDSLNTPTKADSWGDSTSPPVMTKDSRGKAKPESSAFTKPAPPKKTQPKGVSKPTTSDFGGSGGSEDTKGSPPPPPPKK